MPEEDDWGCFRQREGLRLRPKGRTEPGLLSPSWEAVGSDCSAARRSAGEMGRGQNTDKPEGKGPEHQGTPKELVHTAHCRREQLPETYRTKPRVVVFHRSCKRSLASSTPTHQRMLLPLCTSPLSPDPDPTFRKCPVQDPNPYNTRGPGPLTSLPSLSNAPPPRPRESLLLIPDVFSLL